MIRHLKTAKPLAERQGGRRPCARDGGKHPRRHPGERRGRRARPLGQVPRLHAGLVPLERGRHRAGSGEVREVRPGRYPLGPPSRRRWAMSAGSTDPFMPRPSTRSKGSPNRPPSPMTEPTFADPERLAWIKAKIRLPRIATVEDVMGAVVFLRDEHGHEPPGRRRLDGRVSRVGHFHGTQTRGSAL